VKVGEAQFGLASARNATSTLSTPVRIARGESVTITVKGDLEIHNADQGTPGALFSVSYDGDNNGLNGNFATGVSSGATINGSSGDITSNGLRIYRTIPTVADVTTSAVLAAGSDMYKFSVTAGSGRDILMQRVAFTTATTGGATMAVTGFQLFGPSGSVAGVADSPIGVLTITFDAGNVDRLVPAGTTKTYRIQATTVAGLTSANVESLNISLRADGTHSTGNTTLMGTVATIEAAPSTVNNFIWSPNSTTTPEATSGKNDNLDWANGFGIPGFPGVGQNFSTRVFSD